VSKKIAQLPPLATTIPSVLGLVPVTRESGLRMRETGSRCLGIWRSAQREVAIEADAALVAAWHTYWHEWAHIVLYDAGVALKKHEERVCDAIATARVREMLDR